MYGVIADLIPYYGHAHRLCCGVCFGRWRAGLDYRRCACGIELGFIRAVGFLLSDYE